MAWRASLSRNVKEIRFLFCQSSPASGPAREFVKKNYGDIKTRNPTLPVLIRECSGVQPQLWARYGKQPSIPSFPGTRDLALAMVPGRVCSGLLIFGTLASCKCEMFLLELPDLVILGDMASGDLDFHCSSRNFERVTWEEFSSLCIGGKEF
ncbi:unnamed protein product [Triticum turgidum subsp. durum]|uniref:Ribosomal protein/NADH dehydrogenase domain-containing protein n=1 Tax=Triticum turgidum subsp. durum TaxID=4567 RepID=A0A9R1NUU2_TRITD|nr:unnamed protein product [Triticum turgidum subsp. durum]